MAGPIHIIWTILAGIAGVLVGGLTVIIVERTLAESRLERAQASAAQAIDEAQRQVKEIELAAEKAALQVRDEAEAQGKKKREELQREDERLQQRR